MSETDFPKKIIFPDEFLKSRASKISLTSSSSEIDELIYEFYRNYQGIDTISNAFYQAKNLGIVAKYDNQVYLRNYYEFAFFNLTTLFFSILVYRSMFKRKYVNPSNKTEVTLLAISILFLNEFFCVPLYYRKMNRTVSSLDKRYSPIIQKFKEMKKF